MLGPFQLLPSHQEGRVGGLQSNDIRQLLCVQLDDDGMWAGSQFGFEVAASSGGLAVDPGR